MSFKLRITKFTSLESVKNNCFRSLKLNNSFNTKFSKNFTISSVGYCQKIEDKQNKLSKTNKKSEVVKKQKPFTPPFVPEEDRELVKKIRNGDTLYPYTNPTDRSIDIVKEDTKIVGRQIVYGLTNYKMGDLEHKYFPRQIDILVIGSGIMGLSAAYFTQMEFPHNHNILIVDKNPHALDDSITLGAGTISQQCFTYEEEIDMIRFTTNFLSAFPQKTAMPGHEEFQLSYEPMGSLVLADKTNLEQVVKRNEILCKNNVPTQLLNKETLKDKFPWLNSQDLEIGSFATYNEGLIDPWAVAMGLKCKLINLGARFETAEVVDFGFHHGSVRYAVCRLPDGSYRVISFGKCIIAAGMESGRLIDALNLYENVLLKVRIPEEERKRFEYCFYNPEGPGLNTPIVVNPDGVYFRREGLGGYYVVGVDNLKESEPFEVFDEKVKPFLTSRLYNFTNLELKGGWMDAKTSNIANEFGVVGCHPCLYSIFFAIGFTHRGWLYALPAGKAVAENLFHGEYRTVDFTRFQIENLWRRQHEEAEMAKRKRLEAKLRKQIKDI